MIRDARPEDAAAIARVHVDVWRTAYRGLVPEDVLANLRYDERENNWIGILRDRTKFTSVADEGGVIGFASGGAERSKTVGIDGELYAIYILAAHQGRGLGRALVAAIADRLAREGFRSLLAWVLAGNPASAFYEALGGIERKRRKIRIGGATLDEIAYAWSDLATLSAAR